MSATKAAPVELIAAGTVVPAGTVKSAPAGGSVVADVSTGYGGMLNWRITNSSALGAPCVIMFQDSPDGENWFDYEAAWSSDLLSGTVSQGSIRLPIGVKNMRAIAYGNTTSSCLAEAWLTNVTSL